MCLILFAHKVHPEYPLIVAANRDEFFARPTEPAGFWKEYPGLLAGRDLQAGGTWLGVTRSGRFAAITNYREGERSDALHSRGGLTLDFLLSEESPEQYIQKIQSRADDFAGFNLLLGHQGELHYYGNRAGSPRRLDGGIYALGNGTLQDDWHKMHKGREDLERTVASSLEAESLLRLMRDDSRSVDAQLPDTGVGLELERLLSARFIRAEHYGTRATTVMLGDQAGNVEFLEQNYTSDGVQGKPGRFRFQIE